MDDYNQLLPPTDIIPVNSQFIQKIVDKIRHHEQFNALLILGLYIILIIYHLRPQLKKTHRRKKRVMWILLYVLVGLNLVFFTLYHFFPRALPILSLLHIPGHISYLVVILGFLALVGKHLLQSIHHKG